MNIEYWVVRHRPTGILLPARVRATHFEFDIPCLEPRLFRAERAAKNCATCWAQGAWSQETRTESDGWEMPGYTYLAEPCPQRVEGRRREDLEVVRVSLTIPNPTP